MSYYDNTNLLKETVHVLKKHGHKMSDILWVGIKGKEISVENYKAVADKEYDSGFGSQMVHESLLIVGKDWWLERHEYDGSEWFEYKTLPTRPHNKTKISKEEFWNLPWAWDEEEEDDDDDETDAVNTED